MDKLQELKDAIAMGIPEGDIELVIGHKDANGKYKRLIAVQPELLFRDKSADEMLAPAINAANRKIRKASDG